VLWEAGRVREGETITFFTCSGRLSIKKDRELIEMDFPSAKVVQGDLPEEVVAAIGIVPDFVGISGDKWLLEYEDELTIRKLAPNFEALRQYQGRGLIVTSLCERPGVDFVSRYFAPWIGIDEDPVTGSAHVILAPYWSAKLGKVYLSAQQVSTRGGTLKLRLSGDRVYIAGKALTVFGGELWV
jgi:predicted PhzF superfamily epimerase YddE/YHI9